MELKQEDLNLCTRNDLELCRVDGKSYEEAIPDILNIAHFYSHIEYNKWRTILTARQHTYEDAYQDMMTSIFNKGKKSKFLNNIEKKFVWASRNNLGMKYIRNTIGLAIKLNMMSLARALSSKPLNISVETIVSISDTNEKNAPDYLDILEDRKSNTELKASYNLFLDKIPNKAYQGYYIKDNGITKSLDVKTVLNLVIQQYTISDMSKMIYTHQGVNVTYKRMNEIVKDVRSIAKEVYDEGNCLLDVNFKE